MCHNISLHSDIQFTEEAYPGISDERQLELGLDYLELLEASDFPFYNIIYGGDGLKAITAKWGFLPRASGDDKEYFKARLMMVNARAERVLDDPDSMWYKAKDQRVLIPVDGIFESRKILTWKKKVPYYIWQQNRTTFHLPGLVQFYELPDDDGVLHSVPHFTLITTDATHNEPMKQIHNDGPNKHRMPLFLTSEMEKAWISGKLTRNDMREILNFKMPADALAHHPVYTIYRKPQRPDGLPRYAYFAWENLPPLGDDHPLTPQLQLF